MTTKSAAQAAEKWCLDNNMYHPNDKKSFLAGVQHDRARILKEAGKVAIDHDWGEFADKVIRIDDLTRIVNEEGK